MNNKFYNKASKVHGSYYDYSKVDFINWKIKVCIICPEHGEFWQRIQDHFKGSGCPKCGRMRRDKNFTRGFIDKKDWDFKQPEDYKIIPLSKGKFAMVDNEDFDRVKDICWSINSKGYATSRNHNELHKFLMQTPEGLFTDHINGDRLDNRRSNLRICTNQENCWNSKINSNNTTGYKGVSLNNTKTKFKSSISKNKIQYHLGFYNTAEEASIVYDLKALELFGEFAYLNHPEKKEEYLKIIEDEKKRYTRETSRV